MKYFLIPLALIFVFNSANAESLANKDVEAFASEYSTLFDDNYDSFYEMDPDEIRVANKTQSAGQGFNRKNCKFDIETEVDCLVINFHYSGERWPMSLFLTLRLSKEKPFLRIEELLVKHGFTITVRKDNVRYWIVKPS